MSGWLILAQISLFAFVMAEGRGECGLVHHHHHYLLASCPGFYQKTCLSLRLFFFCASFQIKSPLSASRAVSIRRACLESQQRRTKPFKKSPGRSPAPEKYLSWLITCFSQNKYFLRDYAFNIIGFEVNIIRN